jgi:nicotinate-nucleotide adenylyltransferase
MKIAVLGGSFNPIHNGHLYILKGVITEKLADEVWVMPCKKHPLDKFLDKEEDRAAMVKLALNGLKRAKFCDFELKSEVQNYTYLTLRRLKQTYPHDFSWIIGSDLLNQISTWHGYEHLQKEASFVVFHRQGYLVINPGINVEAVVESSMENISSTKVRDRIRNGKSISDLVPRAVEDYIKHNELYVSK